MDLHLQLRPTDSTHLEDSSQYQHIVGSLVYLTVTRLDIVHAVHILSQFVCAPTKFSLGIYFVCCNTYVEHPLNVCSMLEIAHSSFMLTRTPLGRVTQQIAAPSQDTVFFLALLLLLGSLRSKQLYPVLV